MTAEPSDPAGPGDRREPELPRPSDRHLGWMFDGPASFHARTSRFLAEGAARGEHLIFIVDDPRPDQWPERLVDSGVLRIASIAEVYGPRGMVDAEAQRAVFAAALADALDAGYLGIRVAADNTSLAAPGERLQAWLRWERLAEDFITGNPVIGLCGFDRRRIDPGVLAVLAQRHPYTPAG